MTKIVEVVRERTVVTRGPTAVRVVHAGFQGLPGRDGVNAEGGAEQAERAAIALGGQRAVYLSEDGLRYADAMDQSTAFRLVGITSGAVDAGESVAVRRQGEMRDSAWSWDVSLPVFLGANGVLTQTNPRELGADVSLILGYPLSPTSMLVSPREPVVLVY